MNNTQGYYRRRIILDALEDKVVAGVEDDFHHFQVSLTHDSKKITQVDTEAIRVPWTTCPEAADKLKELIGFEISTDLVSLNNKLDRFLHCTHLVELALLAAAQAVRGGRRQYDIVIPDPHIHSQATGASCASLASAAERTVQLTRDGVVILDWRLNGEVIVSPSALVGQKVRDLGAWAARNSDQETFEAIKVMRRCLQVSSARMIKISPSIASELTERIGACYTFQVERVRRGQRSPDKVIDFTSCPNDLLSSLL